MIYPLLECALEMRKRLARRPKLHVFADIVSAFLTTLALLARKAHFESDFVSGFQTLDRRACFCDNAGGLMAKGERFSDQDVAIAEVRIVVEVAAAEAGGGDADLELICARR